MFITHLECSATGESHEAGKLHTVSRAGYPLLARYDLDRVRSSVRPSGLAGRRRDMWRYREVLPVAGDHHIVSLGEGGTPLIHARQLASMTGCSRLYIKDEALNPTGSFKARGISVALSAARECGANRFAIPSAGNAGGALAAYAAPAGCEAHVFMPVDTPRTFKLECHYYGAHVRLIDGLIDDCGRALRRQADSGDWHDVSTLKEPYRLEGKKTMGYELAEQCNWQLPDVIVYPTGGGTGLIGMWKAFDEMQQLGWIGSKRPRMISVQASGCAPIVRAFQQGARKADACPEAATVASGLRVPGGIGDFLILQALYESGGEAVEVSDGELIEGAQQMARHTGLFPAPESGATLAALLKLRQQNRVTPDEHVVLFNTGSGFKYMDTYAAHEAEKEGSGAPSAD